MTAEIMAGPVCDGCGEEYAVCSLMNYADYSQVRLGPNCAPDFLRTIADTMDGGHTAAAAQAAVDDPEISDDVPTPEQQAAGAQAAQAEDEPGSAADHWASTSKVVRSTHGHRSTTRRPSSPRSEPES